MCLENFKWNDSCMRNQCSGAIMLLIVLYLFHAVRWILHNETLSSFIFYLTRGHFSWGTSSNPLPIKVSVLWKQRESEAGAWRGCLLSVWFIQSPLDSKSMSMGLEGLARYPAYLTLGSLEDKGSFGIATPERSSCLISPYALFGL